MNILEYIINLDDEHLDKYIEERIEELESNNEPLTLGYNIDYNPSFSILYNNEIVDNNNIISEFNRYIPMGSRVVYGMIYDNEKKLVSNGGNFYYIDDDSYINDFCRYRRTKEIDNTFMLFGDIYDFIHDYFFSIPTIDREHMMSLITKSNNNFYQPININTYSMFKNKGNAMCSEIGIMAQNILSFLGYNTKYVIGTKKVDGDEPVGHAYNMVSFKESGEEYSLLIDFASMVYIYDINFNKIGEAPFIYYLDNSIDDTYEKMIENNECIIAKEYSYLVQDDIVWVITEDYERIYSSSLDLKNASKKIKKMTKII